MSDVSWYHDTFGMMHRYSCTLYCPISNTHTHTHRHFFVIRLRMNPSYNEAAMDDHTWHNSKATPKMIIKELGMPHKTPIHYDRKKINLQWPEHTSS